MLLDILELEIVLEKLVLESVLEILVLESMLEVAVLESVLETVVLFEKPVLLDNVALEVELVDMTVELV